MVHLHEVADLFLRLSLFEGFRGGSGEGGCDNVLDSTLLMVHVHEVIYDDIRIPHEVTYDICVLLRCALFVVHELILLLLPSMLLR